MLICSKVIFFITVNNILLPLVLYYCHQLMKVKFSTDTTFFTPREISFLRIRQTYATNFAMMNKFGGQHNFQVIFVQINLLFYSACFC